MKFKFKFYKPPLDLKIAILIGLISVLINVFLFWMKGFNGEFYSITQYLRFLDQYPESLRDIRLEPLFIHITYFLTEYGHISPLVLFPILRFSISFFQLIVIYFIIRSLSASRYLAIFGVLAYNFSFTHFLFSGNVFRNHLANLFLLIFIFVLNKVLLNKSFSLRNFFLLSLILAFLFYTHLLVAFVAFLTFILTLVLCFIFEKRDFGLYKTQFLKLYLPAFFVLIIAFLISFQFIFRYQGYSRSLIDDYLIKGPSQVVVSQIPQQPPQLVPHQIEVKKDVIPLAFSYIKTNSIKLFRFLFEYQQVSLSLGFIALTFLGVFIGLFKIRRAETLSIVSLFFVTYFGSKISFFGVGVIGFRLLAISILSAIFLIVLTLNYIMTKFSKTKQILFLVIISFAFISFNFANIFEWIFLDEHVEVTKIKAEKTKEAIEEAKIQIDPNTVVYSLDTGLPNIDLNAAIGYDPTFFTVSDPEVAYQIGKKANLRYFLFNRRTTSVVDEKTGNKIFFDYDKFDDPRYFQKLSEVHHPVINVFVYRLVDVPTASTSSYFRKSFGQAELANGEIDKQLINQKINNWEVSVNPAGSKIWEEVETEDGRYLIDYEGKVSDYLHKIKNPFYRKLQISLPNLESRKKADKILLSLSVEDAVYSFGSSGFEKSISSYLREPAYDLLIKQMSANGGNTRFSLFYWDRTQFRLFFRTFSFLIIITLFFIPYSFLIKRKKNLLTSKTFIILMVIFLLDLILTTYFTEIYKKLLG